jgi:formylmethanofuran dehydrogenase subunit A
MNADVAIYNINPDKLPSDPEEYEKAFSAVAYLFKDGKICVRDGKVVDHGKKHTFWVDVKVKENRQVMHDIREKFLKYYSVNEGNYPVPDSYAPHQHVIAVDATQ